MSSHIAHRPRVIRRIIKSDRNGLPKTVRDHRAGVAVERVTAHDYHRCNAGPDCVHLGTIDLGVSYAKVSAPNPRKWLKWPEESAYHFECLPENLQPVRRFLQREA